MNQHLAVARDRPGPLSDGAARSYDTPGTGGDSLGLPAWRGNGSGFDASTLNGGGPTSITFYALGAGRKGAGRRLCRRAW